MYTKLTFIYQEKTLTNPSPLHRTIKMKARSFIVITYQQKMIKKISIQQYYLLRTNESSKTDF